MTNSVLKISRLLILLAMIVAPLMGQRNVCNFNGEIFQRGENVGSNFETRCGPWEEWPCYCNPDIPFQVECPYCGFASNTRNLVRCARDGEFITLVDLSDDRGKRCTCDASNPAWPEGRCSNDENAEYCKFDVDGETYWYEPGQEVDVVNPCGSRTKYPCYCNPNIQGQLECPYCTVTNGDTVECLKNQESKRFNIFGKGGQSCECDYGTRSNLNFPALPNCNAHDGCTVEESTGDVTFYNNGDKIQRKEGVCGNGFPYLCDTSGTSAATDNLKYPYCEFTDQSGATRCATDGETISFIDENGKNVQCSCEIRTFGAQKQCSSSSESAATPPPTLPGFVPQPTSTPIISSPITQGSSATRVATSLHILVITSAFLLLGSIVG
jgi:hypothetical protein